MSTFSKSITDACAAPTQRTVAAASAGFPKKLFMESLFPVLVLTMRTLCEGGPIGSEKRVPTALSLLDPACRQPERVFILFLCVSARHSGCPNYKLGVSGQTG